MAFEYLRETCKKERDKLFSRPCSGMTRNNVFKLKDGRFRRDIRKESFRMLE